MEEIENVNSRCYILITREILIIVTLSTLHEFPTRMINL